MDYTDVLNSLVHVENSGLNSDFLANGMQAHSFLVHIAHHIGISLWKQLLRSLSNLLGSAALLPSFLMLLCEHLQH